MIAFLSICWINLRVSYYRDRSPKTRWINHLLCFKMSDIRISLIFSFFLFPISICRKFCSFLIYREFRYSYEKLRELIENIKTSRNVIGHNIVNHLFNHKYKLFYPYCIRIDSNNFEKILQWKYNNIFLFSCEMW